MGFGGGGGRGEGSLAPSNASCGFTVRLAATQPAAQAPLQLAATACAVCTAAAAVADAPLSTHPAARVSPLPACRASR